MIVLTSGKNSENAIEKIHFENRAEKPDPS